jgi:AAA+ superfamily predicted ATPase
MKEYYGLAHIIFALLLYNIELNLLGYISIFLILIFAVCFLLYWCYLSEEEKIKLQTKTFDSFFGNLSKEKYSKDIIKTYKNNEVIDSDNSDNSDNLSISLNDLKNKDKEDSLQNEKSQNKDTFIQKIINSDKIRNINDLILIATYYGEHILSKKNKQNMNNYHGINLEKIYKIKRPLIKLNKMVGLKEIKNEIIDMLLYYLMNFETCPNNMLHMTLEGPPGCGKTKLAKIISQIMNGMQILNTDKIIFAKSTDLIGQYVGHTGHKTQAIIDQAMNGILFIDEAYALGTSIGKEHNYSAECINVLNQNLSDNKNKLICIIAGYSEELNKMFFSVNPGLRRRFPFRFKINGYSWNELLKIFIKKIHKLKWTINNDVDLEIFFIKNSPKFKHFGGDIETFIQHIKYSYSRRAIFFKSDKKVIIQNTDIETAFAKFCLNSNDESNSNDKSSNIIHDKTKKYIVNKIKDICNLTDRE